MQPIEYTYNDGYAYEEYDEKPKKKRSFKWLFIVLPILIAIGATIGGIFWWYNAPMQKLTRALDAYDYSAAAQVLPTLSKDELASVSDQMQEYAQTVIDRYNKNEANYDSSYELLDRLQKLFREALDGNFAGLPMEELIGKIECMNSVVADDNDQRSSTMTDLLTDFYGRMALSGSTSTGDLTN